MTSLSLSCSTSFSILYCPLVLLRRGVRGWLGGGVCQLAKVNLPPPLMELKRDYYAMKLGVQCISYNKVSLAILTSWRYSFIKEWTDGTNEKCFKFSIAGHAKYLSYMNLYFLTAYFSMLCTHQINECHNTHVVLVWHILNNTRKETGTMYAG